MPKTTVVARPRRETENAAQPKPKPKVTKKVTRQKPDIPGYIQAAALPSIPIGIALRNVDDPSLFVINCSDSVDPNGVRRKHIVAIGSDPKTRNDLVEIPNTWIPFEITSHLREDVLKTTAFRQAVAKHLIRIVPSADAERVLKTADAVDEIRRLRLADTDAHDDDMMMAMSGAVNEHTITKKKRPPAALAVISIMNRRDLNSRARSASLVAMTNELTERDLKYVIKTAGQGEEKISTWALELLRKRKKSDA